MYKYIAIVIIVLLIIRFFYNNQSDSFEGNWEGKSPYGHDKVLKLTIQGSSATSDGVNYELVKYGPKKFYMVDKDVKIIGYLTDPNTVVFPGSVSVTAKKFDEGNPGRHDIIYKRKN